MSKLRDIALAEFPAADQPELILDHEKPRYMSGMIEYLYNGLLVRITQDRTDVYGDIALIGGQLVSADKLVVLTHGAQSFPAGVRSANGISSYVQQFHQDIRRRLLKMKERPTE